MPQTTIELASVEETAELLRLSRATVYRLMADSDLPYITVGRRRRVPLPALRRWLERCGDTDQSAGVGR